MQLCFKCLYGVVLYTIAISSHDRIDVISGSYVVHNPFDGILLIDGVGRVAVYWA